MKLIHDIEKEFDEKWAKIFVSHESRGRMIDGGLGFVLKQFLRTALSDALNAVVPEEEKDVTDTSKMYKYWCGYKDCKRKIKDNITKFLE